MEKRLRTPYVLVALGSHDLHPPLCRCVQVCAAVPRWCLTAGRHPKRSAKLAATPQQPREILIVRPRPRRRWGGGGGSAAPVGAPIEQRVEHSLLLVVEAAIAAVTIPVGRLPEARGVCLEVAHLQTAKGNPTRFHHTRVCDASLHPRVEVCADMTGR